MNQFSERYKTLTTPELLKVIDTPGDYQALAVEAAGMELANRGLTEQEIADARAENESLALEKQSQKEKSKIFENKVKDIGASFVETIGPVQSAPQSASRIIAIVSILLALRFLFQLYNNFGFIKYLVTYKEAHLGMQVLSYFLPIMLVPVAGLLLWKRKVLGWLLSSALFIFSVLGAFISLCFAVKEHFKYADLANNTDGFITSSVWDLLFYGGCLWMIFKKDVKEVYRVDKSAVIIASSLGVILLIFTFFAGL
jgi:hypothetical protein